MLAKTKVISMAVGALIATAALATDNQDEIVVAMAQGSESQSVPARIELPQPGMSKNVFMINKKSGKALQIRHWSFSQGASAETKEWDENDPIQYWKVTCLDQEKFIVSNLHTRKDLALLNHQPRVGQKIRNDAPEHMWQLVSSGNGFFKLTNQSTGLALTETDDSGSPVVGLLPEEKDNQLWRFTPAREVPE